MRSCMLLAPTAVVLHTTWSPDGATEMVTPAAPPNAQRKALTLAPRPAKPLPRTVTEVIPSTGPPGGMSTDAIGVS